MRNWRQHISLFVALGLSILGSAQDDVASREAMMLEQQQINFQTFFFEALQQKAIENYDKAIYALEACHNIDKENVAVLFEMSKNYALMFKYTEAEYYILKGLEKDPQNLFMLRHLREIKTKQNDFPGAIKVQKQLMQQVPEEETELVILYIKSGDIDQAILLLKKLDEEGRVPEGLESLKASLLQEDIPEAESIAVKQEPLPQSKSDRLLENYRNNKDFTSLKALLESEWKSKHYLDLLTHCEEGLSLFPAQPYLYLMHGKVLNALRKYPEARTTIEEGLTYLIDDPETEGKMYKEIGLSYRGEGNNKKAAEYERKAEELK